MKIPKNILQVTVGLTILLVLPLLFFNNCGGGGGGGGSSAAATLIKVPMKISSGGITVGMNTFKFDSNQASSFGTKFPKLLHEILWSTANASTSYRVSPNKVKLNITNISFQSVEQNVDASTESAFNSALVCEVDYDATNPNQTTTCTVELQAGLHYQTIDFRVAPNVQIYINDGVNNIYTTAAGLTSSNPGGALDYFTANYNNNNTSFHAEFPIPIDTTAIATTLSKITTLDNCANTIEIKMVLSNGTVLSDTTFTPNPACGTTGTTQNTINIGTENLNVVVDMIHGIEVDNNFGTLTVSSTPWWTIAGTFGSGLSIKHYASTASGITSATYLFPPFNVGINELKIAYANGVAVGAQMVPNGFSATFCHEDFDTPSNSPGNGYVGSDGNGAAWAVGPWSGSPGKITNYTSEYYLNTTTGLFSCNPISSDPDPNPGQALDTFSTAMPNPSGFMYNQSMTRIDN